MPQDRPSIWDVLFGEDLTESGKRAGRGFAEADSLFELGDSLQREIWRVSDDRNNFIYNEYNRLRREGDPRLEGAERMRRPTVFGFWNLPSDTSQARAVVDSLNEAGGYKALLDSLIAERDRVKWEATGAPFKGIGSAIFKALQGDDIAAGARKVGEEARRTAGVVTHEFNRLRRAVGLELEKGAEGNRSTPRARAAERFAGRGR